MLLCNLTLNCGISSKLLLVTSDVNYAEQRLMVLDAEPRISFSEKKNEPEPNRDSSQTSSSRVETLTKCNRAEILLF